MSKKGNIFFFSSWCIFKYFNDNTRTESKWFLFQVKEKHMLVVKGTIMSVY